jgi:hypothetical protein
MVTNVFLNEPPRSKLRGINLMMLILNEASFGEFTPKRLNQFMFVKKKV